MALNYDGVSSIARKHYIKKIEDTVFNSSYLLKQMRARPDVLDGNDPIVHPLLMAMGRSGAYAEWDLIDVRPKQTRTAADFYWKNLYANMTISGDQEDKISGEDEVLNLLQVESETAEKTLVHEVATSLYNDGSNSTYPHGLRHIIGYDRTLGGIPSDTYDWFDANVAVDIDSNFSTTNLTVANLTNPSSDYFILTVMRKVWMKCIHGGEHPDGIYVSEGVFNLYEQVLQPQVTYNREPNAAVKMAADGGFQVLEYKGVPFIYDEYCPTAFLFYTNSKYLNMKIHKKRNFDLGPWQKPVNQIARIAQITLKMQFVTGNPRYLGKIEFASAVG